MRGRTCAPRSSGTNANRIASTYVYFRSTFNVLVIPYFNFNSTLHSISLANKKNWIKNVRKKKQQHDEAALILISIFVSSISSRFLFPCGRATIYDFMSANFQLEWNRNSNNNSRRKMWKWMVEKFVVPFFGVFCSAEGLVYLNTDSWSNEWNESKRIRGIKKLVGFTKANQLEWSG